MELAEVQLLSSPLYEAEPSLLEVHVPKRPVIVVARASRQESANQLQPPPKQVGGRSSTPSRRFSGTLQGLDSRPLTPVNAQAVNNRLETLTATRSPAATHTNKTKHLVKTLRLGRRFRRGSLVGKGRLVRGLSMTDASTQPNSRFCRHYRISFQ